MIHDCVIVRSFDEIVDSDEAETEGIESDDIVMELDDEDDNSDQIEEKMEGLIMIS